MEENIKKKRKINKKKIVFTLIVLLLIMASVIIFAIYCMNANFRRWADKNLLMKEIMQGNTISIEFNGENSSNVYAFNKYVVVLENKILKIYNTLGIEEKTITTDISNPIFDAVGNYLIIAEKNGDSIYLLEGKELLWHNTIEGEISQIEINENGYVGVVISDISYKNIINVFDEEGNSLFKTYVATNKVVDISISRNNKYLALAEIDMSGVLIQSSVRVIDIEKAKTDPSNSIINTHFADVGKLILNIEYQNKERLLCVYSDSINSIEENENKDIIELGNNKITFASIELNNNILTVEEKQTGEYTSTSYINILNIANSKTKKYEIEEVSKEVYTSEKVIVLNLGTELHIINTNGWLMKKYISEQEINNVIISDKIVGVIYRDKIEIIEL